MHSHPFRQGYGRPMGRRLCARRCAPVALSSLQRLFRDAAARPEVAAASAVCWALGSFVVVTQVERAAARPWCRFSSGAAGAAAAARNVGLRAKILIRTPPEDGGLSEVASVG